MFVLKIGKAKHKFTLKITIAKYKYQPQQSIQKGCIYKVKFTRGSHSIEAYSTPAKKGSIKFPKTEYQIPLTLFYDESDHVYLQKQAEVKTYLCDENGNVVKSIGKTSLNIADYADRQKFGLEVQIQGENKKVGEDVTITFQMKMQRLDDDAKSVDTQSQSEMDFRSKEMGKKHKQSKQVKQAQLQPKIKNNLLDPIVRSNISVKSAQEQLKLSKITVSDDMFSERSKSKNRSYTPIKKLQQGKPKNTKKDQHQEEQQYDQQNLFFNNFQIKVNQVNQKTSKQQQRSASRQQHKVQSIKETTKQKKQNQNILERQSQQSKRRSKQKTQIKSKIPKQSTQQKQSTSSGHSKFTKKSPQQQQHSFQQLASTQDTETKSSSLQLRLMLATKKAQTFQKQNHNLKAQTQKLKSLIQQLIEQKNKHQQNQSTTSTEAKKQIQNYKKLVIQKEIRINELQSLNKLIIERQNGKQKQITQNEHQIKELRMKLEHEKNKIAKVVQMAMESGNLEMLDIVETQIKDDFY